MFLLRAICRGFSAGRVGGEALGDRGGEARLVDDGEVTRLVNSKSRQTRLSSPPLLNVSHFDSCDL